MSKCTRCGEEIGDSPICPYCGASPSKKPPRKNDAGNDIDLLDSLEKNRLSLIDKCSKAVVKLTIHNKEISTGTGFVINDDLIITNAHVICDDDFKYHEAPIMIEYNDSLELGRKRFAQAVVLKYDYDEDIAILRPASKMIPSVVPRLTLALEEPRMGEEVFTIGNPLHYRFTYMDGKIANAHYKSSGRHKSEILQTTIILNHGNSGGPLFNLAGEACGITTFSELDGRNEEIIGYSFSVKASTILNLIKTI